MTSRRNFCNCRQISGCTTDELTNTSILLLFEMQHALQASKTDDAELRNTIRQAKNAIEAKKAARVVKVSCCVH